MKKVVVLGDTLVSDEPLGIQRYGYEILRELDNMELDFDCELLIPESSSCSISFKQIKIVQYGKQSGFLWRQLCFPRYVRKCKAVGVDMTLGLCIAGCDIVCLHDCIYENYPDDFVTIKDKIKRVSYLIRARIAALRSKKIVTLSQYSKQEIMRYHHISGEKIQIIPCGWQHFERITPDESVLDALGIRGKEYYFSLGSKLPHKNFKWVIEAARQNSDALFVVTGTNRLRSDKTNQANGELSNVIFTGFLSDGQVKALMQSCKAFIHPSLYEGFGIPPMEAMSCGAPALVSDATCLPEVYDNSVHYFDGKKYSGIKMDEYMCDSVSEPIRVLNRFSWTASAEKFAAIISLIL